MLAGGVFHSIFIDPKSQVWTSGRNDLGQLGRHECQDEQYYLVRGVPSAVQVSAAGFHSAVLDHQGNVWMFGSNQQLQTGIDSVLQTVVLPTKILNLPFILMVSCGSTFTIVLDDNGHIWGAGDNTSCQMGCEGVNSLDRFTHIITADEMGRIVRIGCGKLHSIVQNEADELWSTGNNVNGQLGLGHNQKSSKYKKIPSEGHFQVQSFVCGDYHTAVIDKSGGVWTVGNGFAGNLGLNNASDINTLTNIPNIPPMVYIACGASSTIMIDETGSVYVCGDNRFGQLGAGYSNNVYVPRLLPHLPKISEACLSESFSLLVDYLGGMWFSGKSPCNSGLRINIPNTKFAQLEGLCADVSITSTARRFNNTKRAI